MSKDIVSHDVPSVTRATQSELLPVVEHEHKCSHCGNIFMCGKPHFMTRTDKPNRGKMEQVPPPYYQSALCSACERRLRRSR